MGSQTLKSALITGGTGFIGSRLALKLARGGLPVKVMGLIRRPDEVDNAAELRSAGVEVIERSITTLEPNDPALAGVNLVYHLAAVQHEMNVPDQVYRDVNVEGVRKLLDASIAADVKRLVYGSTIGVWGELEGELSEAVPPCPDTIYGETKLEAEHLIQAAGDRIETCTIRLGECYGPGDSRLLKLFKMTQKGKSLIVGDGKNRHHPVFVDDVCDALCMASALPAATGETFLIAGPEVVTSRQMIDAIADALDVPRKVRHLPMMPMLAAATLLEKALRPLGIQPPLHRRRLGFFVKDQTLNAERIAAVLGHVSKVGFREGAIRTAQWYINRSLLEIQSDQPPSTNKSIPVT